MRVMTRAVAVVGLRLVASAAAAAEYEVPSDRSAKDRD